MIREARFSDCERFRYSLGRAWEPLTNVKRAAFIMLNPSKAGRLTDDPTVRSCIRLSKRLGAGRFIAANMFARIATDPDDLHELVRKHGELHPEVTGGQAADQVLVDLATDKAATLIVAWGAAGARYPERRDYVLSLLAPRTLFAPLYCYGVTATGQPRHPLFVPSVARLEPWNPRS